MKSTRIRNRITTTACLVCLIATMVAGVRPARAADYHWGVADHGDFSHFMNWIPFGVPADLDTAVFSQPYMYSVFLEDAITTNKQLRVEDGIVTFLMGVPSGNCDAPATYNLLGSGRFITTAAIIGTDPDVPATLRIRHTVASCDPNAYIEADGGLIIAQVENSEGSLVLGDSTAQSTYWTSSYPTMVGLSGEGMLKIDQADEMTNSTATIGVGQHAVGTAVVRGTWTNNGALTIGDSGHATLTVHHTVTNSGDAFVGKRAGAVGTVNLEPQWNLSTHPDGWLCQGSLYIGGDDTGSGGTGSVNLYNGSDVLVDQGTTVWNSGLIDVFAGVFDGDDVNIRSGGTVTVGGDLGDWEVAAFECADLDVWAGGALETTSPDGFVNCDRLHSQGTVSINEGNLSVQTLFTATPGGVFSLAHGSLNVGSLDGYHGTFTWFNGNLNITNDDFLIDAGELLGDDVYINNAKSLSVSGELGIGTVSGGAMTLTVGGEVSSGSGVVGSLSGSAGLGSVDMAGADTSWTIDSDLRIRGVNGAEMRLFAGASVDNDSAYLAAEPGSTAEVLVTGHNSQWSCGGSLYAGGAAVLSGGTGTLQVANAGELNVAGTMKVWDDFLVEIDVGTVITTDLDLTGAVAVLNGGTLDVRNGTLDIDGAGTLDGTIHGNANTSVQLNSGDAQWSLPGTLLIGSIGQGAGHVNELALSPGAVVDVGATVTVADSTKLTLGGGTIDAAVINMFDEDLEDFGTLNGSFSTTGSVTATGELVIGSIGNANGVQIGGPVRVGGHHVTLNNQGMILIADSINIFGGTLSVPDGFRNSFGNHITGFGLVDTPDDPTRRMVNEGGIIGHSANRRIELSGYLEGTGRLDYAIISGTDNPGFADPVAVERGYVEYSGKLVVTIGGPTPGTKHDQINHSGQAGLGGELIVELIDGFEPAWGDRFTILTYGSYVGQFETHTLPPLAHGLHWGIDYGPTAVTLTIDGQMLGDCDLDNDLDLVDYMDFEACLTGPASGQAGCDCFDVNNSGTVDLADFAALQGTFTGP